MSYEEAKVEIGREPITIVELSIDYCTLNYGEGECGAILGVTGSDYCYNTRATCQDIGAYPSATGQARSKKIYRFCTNSARVSPLLGAIPSLAGVSFSPTRIDPGKTLGRRGEVSVDIIDHPYHDITIDKYVDQRTYDPNENGTFWSKFKRRNPYYSNRIMTIYTGYVSDPWDWDNFQSRTYMIDQIDGPSNSGVVKITGRDILKLADDDRAVCPRPTLARLDGDIAAGAVAFNVLPADAGDNFQALDYIRIGTEVMRITTIVGDAITVDAGDRGQFNTDDKSHKVDDAVQLCKLFDSVNIVDIFYELLVDYGNVPEEYIDMDEWEAEGLEWLTDFDFSALITAPTGVTELLTELVQSSTAYIFWHEIERKIKLVAVKPPEDALITISDTSHIIDSSMSIKEMPADRISEIYFNWVQIDPTQKLTEDNNYRRLSIRVDVDAESPVEYGDYRIKKVYSRWMGEANDSAMTAVQQRMLAMYRNIPIEVSFRIDAKDSSLWTGDEFYLLHRNIVNNDGTPRATLMRVVEASEATQGTWYSITARESDREFSGRYFYIRPDGDVDYEFATDREDRGGWISVDGEMVSDGTEGYSII